MYVCTLLSFFLSLSLPLRFPLFLLFFSPLLFHFIHRAGNSNGMESFQAGRSGISSLLRCAMRDPASFNNGDALPIPLCRMKKSSADGSIASRNIFYPPPSSATSFPRQRGIRVDVWMLMLVAKRRRARVAGAALISIENPPPPPIITLANLNIPLHFPSRPITRRLTEGEISLGTFIQKFLDESWPRRGCVIKGWVIVNTRFFNPIIHLSIRLFYLFIFLAPFLHRSFLRREKVNLIDNR